MQTRYTTLLRSLGISLGVSGGFLLLLPATGMADDTRWERQQSALEQQFRPGHQRGFYAQKLGELGYAITAINAYDEAYVEYEIVKKDLSYEVQIGLNAATGRAMAIDIDRNWWQAGATETALATDTQEQDQGSLEERWERGKTKLERALAAGQERDLYLTKLVAQGYLITSVNYNDTDYLEYEVIKGDLTYEIQIDIDPEARQATQVAVVTNTWQADATEQALARRAKLPPQAQANARRQAHPILRATQHSDRDQTLMQQMIAELETLPIDKQKSFYPKALDERDYQVIRINVDTDKKYTLEVGKDGRGIALHIFLDPQSGKGTRLDAVPLWWNMIALEEWQAVEHADTLGVDWSGLPQDQASLSLFRETYHPAEPASGQPDQAALQQRVDQVFEHTALTQPHHAVTVSVREDGGVVLDGTVGSLGAALAAYEAVGKAENTRYVIVDLDILGSQAHEDRIRQTSSQPAQPVQPARQD